MKSIKKYMAPIFLSLPLLWAGLSAKEDIPELTSLNPNTNSELKALREDVKKTLASVKGGLAVDKMPKLRFYKYRLQSGDSFWKVLTATSLDIDTLMTVNGISSPGIIKPGATIYVSNMRGVIINNESGTGLREVLLRKKINPEYIRAVNGSLDKKYLFVPCGEISGIQRSLFLGTGFMFPLYNGKQTSGFGRRNDPFGGRRNEFHSGIDIACPIGSRVLASRDGTVIFTGNNGGYGKLVILSHEHGYCSFYGHLSGYKVKPGQKVSRGDVIGMSGNTGRTTGPHLHFEVKKEGRSFDPGLLAKPL
ncbi:MAG: M23 family metallopeptidase [Spirochaetia bacterium]|jgi:murein DD-endopeptidase MepM/ murein hydrolase activator NlpD|nr:M23 family metallopeptidase [Spirochaetia bacterium]